jgi:hypothetical protein
VLCRFLAAMVPDDGMRPQSLGFLGKGEFHGIIWDDMGPCLRILCQVIQVEVLPFLGGCGEDAEALAAEGIWELLNDGLDVDFAVTVGGADLADSLIFKF